VPRGALLRLGSGRFGATSARSFNSRRVADKMGAMSALHRLQLGLLLAAGCSAEPELTSGGDAGSHPMHGAARPEVEPGPSAPGACEAHQPVLAPEVVNARDLGGTPLADGQTVACGVVYRGGPLAIGDEGCSAVAELALGTVLDLRIESEERSRPDAACVDAKRVLAPFPIPYGLAAADYLAVLHETSSIATVFHTFGDPGAYPVYFHCTYGRDRTGVIGALLLLALGASRETVMREYLLSEPNVGAYPESLGAVLDEIEQRGGAETVLFEAGITAAELDVIRQSLVAPG